MNPLFLFISDHFSGDGVMLFQMGHEVNRYELAFFYHNFPVDD